MLLVLIGHANGSLIPYTSSFWVSSGLNNIYHYLRGASGVDLFFAISGFVIARDLYPKLVACTSKRSFMDISLAFWIRRVWRIFPTAWLWLAVILFASVFFNESGVFHSFKANLNSTIAAVFQYYNVWLALCFRHYDCGANFYYWTLSLEEQFYFLLPLTILYSRRWFPYLLGCMILFQLFFPHRPPMMTVFRTDALLLGVLIALWSVKPSYKAFELHFLSHRWPRRIVVLSLFAAMMADESINTGILGAFSWGVIALICASLVLISSYNKDYLMPQGRLKRFIMWLGSRSCSIYLAHIPAYYFIREVWFRMLPKGTPYEVTYTLPYILSGIGMVFLLGELSYRFVESPSRTKGTEISTRFLQRRTSQQPIDQHEAGSGS